MPTYEPDSWNDGNGDQYSNNCYDYAVDKKSGQPVPHKSQPGDGSGRRLTSLDCNNPADDTGVDDAAERDGLKPSDRDSDCDPGCWKVALVISPDDYHWYRQDDDGSWSHKPGHGEATNKDASGNDISDPEAADRDYGWTDYSTFCGYFCVCRDLITVGVPRRREEGKGLLAHALIHSGIEDPNWELTSSEESELNELLSVLPEIPDFELRQEIPAFLVTDVQMAGERGTIWSQPSIVGFTPDEGPRRVYQDETRVFDWLYERAMQQEFGDAVAAAFDQTRPEIGS